MKKTTLEIIKEKVAIGQNIPTAVIEYNLEELPKEVQKDSFFGVKARFNSDLPKETVNLIYTM